MRANKVNILWWVITLLAVLNLTTIGVIIYHNTQEQKADEALLFEPDARPINGAYFRHELSFDNAQMKVFRTTNRRFRQSANAVITGINRCKQELFVELQKAEPDRDKLNELSGNIGALHAELKKETVDFYLSLSEVCDSTQKQKLKEIFTPLFKDTPVRYGGQMYGRGRGAGKAKIN